MGDALTGFCEMPFEADPGGASFLAVMSLFIIGRADGERRRGNILEIYATEPHFRRADNFGPRPGAKCLLLESGGATRVPLDQRGHPATLFLAVRFLRQKPGVLLPPMAHATLPSVDHSVPPTLVDYGYAATQGSPPQGCRGPHAWFPRHTARGGSARILANTCVESVRCRPRALSQPLCPNKVSIFSSKSRSRMLASQASAKFGEDRGVETRIGEIQIEEICANRASHALHRREA